MCKGGTCLAQQHNKFIYTFTCHEDELSLCRLEMRSLFGFDTDSSLIESTVKIDPSRSPFINERIDVLYRADSLADMAQQLMGLSIDGATFKVLFIEHADLAGYTKVSFDERRKIEREIGQQIIGKVDLVHPNLMFAIMKCQDSWVFGQYIKSESIWFLHQTKPKNYSTALSTRVARAVVNIAVPEVDNNIKAIDPCCGSGTVLVEALSMGINIVGSDNNPLVCPIARENIAYFGLKGEVSLKDILDVTGFYDVAIIDMPYNLCSVLDPDKQLDMLRSARSFARKVVVVTIETIDYLIEKAGFEIVDRGVAKKGSFTRQILVCE